eukprot:scaffold9_cov97-Isochrysis_galbana.AAC.1
MGKKDKLSLDPVAQHRKDEKKKLAAKMKKQRDERKEAKFQLDPKSLQAEIDKVRSHAELRQAGGSTARLQAKIDELTSIKEEAERRRAAQVESQPEAATAGQREVSLDLSAILGKRKAPAAAPAPAPAASRTARPTPGRP